MARESLAPTAPASSLRRGEASAEHEKQNFLFLELFLASCCFYIAHLAELRDVTARDFQSAVSHIAAFLPLLRGWLLSQGCFWGLWASTLAALRLYLGFLGPLMLWVWSPRERRKVLQVFLCPWAGLEGAEDGVAGKLLCGGDGEM